jgi:lipid-binding SYLF domain-containing protein
MILNTPDAVVAFSRPTNVTLGGSVSVAAGPIGRTAEGAVALQAAVFSYSRSQGLFAGVSLQGTVIGVKDDYNEAYYGKPVTAQEILSGKVQPPAGARNLLEVLSKY